MNFQFFSPARIVAGRGKISEIGAIASEFGKRVFFNHAGGLFRRILRFH